MEKMIRYSRATGVRRLVGEVLTDNTAMLHLSDQLGFRRERFIQGDVIEVAMDVRPPEGAPKP
jgi:L-amino acid N-acyltransferase YncA